MLVVLMQLFFSFISALVQQFLLKCFPALQALVEQRIESPHQADLEYLEVFMLNQVVLKLIDVSPYPVQQPHPNGVELKALD
jgi:hypothetical protein